MKSEERQKVYKKPVKCPPAGPVCADCEPPKHPCPQNVILNCCTGTGLAPTIIQPPQLILNTPISLVCTALDTTCLCKPMVKVEFNCIIINSVGDFLPESLVFRLKKSCDNGQEVECGIWAHSRNASANLDERSFRFVFCDCSPCPGCCTYSVELVDIILPQEQVTIGINGPTLKVTAIETCDDRKIGCPSAAPLCAESGRTYAGRKMEVHSAAPVCADCEPKHPCPQGVIFNCCTGAGIQNTGACPPTPRSLLCVTIDTTCLCRPRVVLDFSAIIAAAIPPNESLILTFQVKKSCDNGQEIQCGSWSTLISRALGIELGPTTSDSFSFTFCDCNPCSACCTYAVELVFCAAFNADDPTQPFSGSFSIDAPTAVVTAFDACPQ